MTHDEKKELPLFQLDIQAEDWQQLHELSGANLDRGGIFVACDHPPPVGAPVEINVAIPDGETLKVSGVVVSRSEVDDAGGGASGVAVQLDVAAEAKLSAFEARAPEPPAEETKYEKATAGGLSMIATVEWKEESEPATVSPLGQSKKRPSTENYPVLGFMPTGTAQPIFGIDFGSSGCSIALVTGEDVHVLKDKQGRDRVPSIVAYVRGQTLVGWDARSAALAAGGAPDDEHCVVTVAKRLIGQEHEDPRLQQYLDGMPLRTSISPSGEVLIRTGDEHVSVVQVCAEILRKVLEIGQQATGLQSRRVVLAAPFSFSGRQRAVLRAAAHLAGMDVAGIVPEPIASAMAHGMGKREGAHIALYDLGGGGFNCSVVTIHRQRIKVLAAGGDAWIGGERFDRALANYATSHYELPPGERLRDHPSLWMQLLQRCERIKTRLSTMSSVRLPPPMMASGMIGPAVEITKDLFDKTCREFVEATFDRFDGCIAEAGVAGTELDDIIVVGGMSNAPLVRSMLEERYGCPVDRSISLEHAVVVGAALRGRRLELISQRRAKR